MIFYILLEDMVSQHSHVRAGDRTRLERPVSETRGTTMRQEPSATASKCKWKLKNWNRGKSWSRSRSWSWAEAAAQVLACYPCSVDVHDDDDDGVADDVWFARARDEGRRWCCYARALTDVVRPSLGWLLRLLLLLPSGSCLLCQDWLAKVQIDQRRHATHWGRAASVWPGIACDLLHAIFGSPMPQLTCCYIFCCCTCGLINTKCISMH